MRKSATRRLLLPLLLFAPALLALSCVAPLPEPELTATAEGQVLIEKLDRGGREVVASSSGAPSSSALSLQPAAGTGQAPSVLAPLESDELAGTTVVPGDSVTPAATPEPRSTGEATPEPTRGSATPQPSRTPEPVDPSTFSSDLLALINKLRIENGIPALVFDATLTAAATDYARLMAETGSFGHYPGNGSTPAGRIAAAGFAGQYKGEALSAGQASPAVAAGALLSSSQHAAILLSSSSVAAGVGHFYDPGSYYGHYWVVVTANPAPSSE